jgi:hypothetical protein
MASFNYTLETFLANPAPGDTQLRVYDKNRVIKHTLNPDLSSFFVKNNLVIIKVENTNDIILNFETTPVAIQALAKLNWAKKEVSKSPVIIVSTVVFSLANLNMDGQITVVDGDLACDQPIGDDPLSNVRVFINGVEVSVGADLDCFFSPDGGTTKRNPAEAVSGDFLHWNGSYIGFQLDAIDQIDFIYLIKNN